jgi:hypothetical protein
MGYRLTKHGQLEWFIEQLQEIASKRGLNPKDYTQGPDGRWVLIERVRANWSGTELSPGAGLVRGRPAAAIFGKRAGYRFQQDQS